MSSSSSTNNKLRIKKEYPAYNTINGNGVFVLFFLWLRLRKSGTYTQEAKIRDGKEGKKLLCG